MMTNQPFMIGRVDISRFSSVRRYLSQSVVNKSTRCFATGIDREKVFFAQSYDLKTIFFKRKLSEDLTREIGSKRNYFELNSVPGYYGHPISAPPGSSNEARERLGLPTSLNRLTGWVLAFMTEAIFSSYATKDWLRVTMGTSPGLLGAFPGLEPVANGARNKEAKKLYQMSFASHCFEDNGWYDIVETFSKGGSTREKERIFLEKGCYPIFTAYMRGQTQKMNDEGNGPKKARFYRSLSESFSGDVSHNGTINTLVDIDGVDPKIVLPMRHRGVQGAPFAACLPAVEDSQCAREGASDRYRFLYDHRDISQLNEELSAFRSGQAADCVEFDSTYMEDAITLMMAYRLHMGFDDVFLRYLENTLRFPIAYHRLDQPGEDSFPKLLGSERADVAGSFRGLPSGHPATTLLGYLMGVAAVLEGLVRRGLIKNDEHELFSVIKAEHHSVALKNRGDDNLLVHRKGKMEDELLRSFELSTLAKFEADDNFIGYSVFNDERGSVSLRYDEVSLVRNIFVKEKDQGNKHANHIKAGVIDQYDKLASTEFGSEIIRIMDYHHSKAFGKSYTDLVIHCKSTFDPSLEVRKLLLEDDPKKIHYMSGFDEKMLDLVSSRISLEKIGSQIGRIIKRGAVIQKPEAASVMRIRDFLALNPFFKSLEE